MTEHSFRMSRKTRMWLRGIAIVAFAVVAEAFIWHSVACIRPVSRVQLDGMMFQTGVLSPLMNDYIEILEEMRDSGSENLAKNDGRRNRLMTIRERIEPHLAVLGQATELLSDIRGSTQTTRSISEAIDQTRATLAIAQAELGEPTNATRIEKMVSSLQDHLALFAGSVVHTIEQDVNAQQERSNFFATLIGVLLSVLLAIGLVLLRLTWVLRKRTDDLNRLATTDTLTGLINRRECMRQATRISLVARRKNLPVTLAIIDLDHFKTVNDTHGHPAGDAVLRSVALTISTGRRDGDVVARLGGEEFAIIMCDTDTAVGSVLCERIRLGVESSAISFDGIVIPITASIGVATGYGGDGEFERLYMLADRALYEAKEMGRNRLVVADCHSVHEPRSGPSSCASAKADLRTVSVAGL